MKTDISHIGQEFYPIDNSYSQDLTTGEYPDINQGSALAGANSPNINPIKVRILSEPLFISLNNVFGELEVHEMVIVGYNNRKFLVLNCFESEITENILTY